MVYHAVIAAGEAAVSHVRGVETGINFFNSGFRVDAC